jgi:hypothetical protein
MSIESGTAFSVHSDAVPMSSYWVAPDGTLLYVESCDHEYTARKLGFYGASDMERMGFIHLSTYAMGYVVLDERYAPTFAQRETMAILQDKARRAMMDDAQYALAVRVARACMMYFEELDAIEAQYGEDADADYLNPLG